MLLKDRIARELERLRAEHGGLLHPAQVVEFARDPDTALHSQFTWDDTEAAAAYRLEQARRVMRLQFFVDHQVRPPVRALVSLTTDRRSGGGYRSLQDVLADDAAHAQMLDDALAELRRVRMKYQTLKELKPVWDAAERIEYARRDNEPVRAANAV